MFFTVFSEEKGHSEGGGEGKGHGKRIAAAVVNPASGTPERSALPKVQGTQAAVSLPLLIRPILFRSCVRTKGRCHNRN